MALSECMNEKKVILKFIYKVIYLRYGFMTLDPGKPENPWMNSCILGPPEVMCQFWCACMHVCFSLLVREVSNSFSLVLKRESD